MAVAALKITATYKGLDLNMKDIIEKIELYLAQLHKNMPHLPQGGRKWMADNVWWIMLIAAILGGIGVLALVMLTLLGSIFVAGAVFLFSAKFGGPALLIAVIIVALTILNFVVSIMAVKPLKTHLKSGWLLLAASLAISFTAAILTDLIKQDPTAVIKEIIFLGIGAYVIFEIREYFSGLPPIAK